MSSGVPASLPSDRLTPNQGDAIPPLALMLLRDLPCLFSLLMAAQCLLDAFQGVTLIKSTSVSLLTKGHVRDIVKRWAICDQVASVGIVCSNVYLYMSA